MTGAPRQTPPNKGLELTASSVRSYVAPASGSSSGLALGAYGVEGKIMKDQGHDFLVTTLEAPCDASSLPDIVTARIRIRCVDKDQRGRLSCCAES